MLYEVITDPGLVHHPVDDLRQMIERPAQIAALTGGILNQYTDALRHLRLEIDMIDELFPELDIHEPHSRFVADSKLELYVKKTKQRPPAPKALLPELPQDLSDLCLALMDPDIRNNFV